MISRLSQRLIGGLHYILSTGTNCAESHFDLRRNLIEIVPLLTLERHEKKTQFMAVFSIPHQRRLD
jgi:hypothetical protein